MITALRCDNCGCTSPDVTDWLRVTHSVETAGHVRYHLLRALDFCCLTCITQWSLEQSRMARDTGINIIPPGPPDHPTRRLEAGEPTRRLGLAELSADIARQLRGRR